MTNSKMTQRIISTRLSLLQRTTVDDLVIFAEGRIAQLKKKASSKKPTKTQAENEGIKDTVRAALGSVDRAVTVTELQELNEALGALSNQRVSALLRQMIEANEVVKTVEKKKSYFSLAVGE